MNITVCKFIGFELVHNFWNLKIDNFVKIAISIFLIDNIMQDTHVGCFKTVKYLNLCHLNVTWYRSINIHQIANTNDIV